MNKNTIYQILAVLLVGGVLYYIESSQNILGNPQTLKKEGDQLPYAVAGKTATKHYSASGILDYTFSARQLKYYRAEENPDPIAGEDSPVGDYTVLDEPKFVIYLPDRSWYIESRSGKITDQGSTITLEGNVRVWRNDEDESNTELTTKSLKILPHEKFAETEAPVRIRSNRGEVTAVGMEVSFSDKKIKLLSRVRERYEAL